MPLDEALKRKLALLNTTLTPDETKKSRTTSNEKEKTTSRGREQKRGQGSREHSRAAVTSRPSSKEKSKRSERSESSKTSKKVNGLKLEIAHLKEKECPKVFNREIYQKNIATIHKQRETIVFSSTFSPDGRFLVVGNNYGQVGLFDLSHYLSKAYWKEALKNTTSVTQHNYPVPTFIFSAHSKRSSIYSLAFSENMLLTGGESELRVWDWTEIVELADLCNSTISPPKRIKEPKIRLEIHVGTKATEINDMSVTKEEENKMVFVASGKCDGYGYDLETGTQMCELKGHSKYLHCIEALHSKNRVLTGSEDGTVRLWDRRDQKTIQILDPSKGTASASFKAKTSLPYIGCMTLDSDQNWMVCGGGGRYLTCWHLSSMTPHATMPTRGVPQAVTFFNDKIITGGNEDILYHWGKTSGKSLRHVSINSQSVFSLGVNDVCISNRVLVATGSSPFIDVFTSGEVFTNSLKFKF